MGKSNVLKNLLKAGPLGWLDDIAGGVMQTAFGAVSGAGRALIGKKAPKIANIVHNNTLNVGGFLGSAIGNLTYGVTKGAVNIGAGLIKATIGGVGQSGGWGKAFGKAAFHGVFGKTGSTHKAGRGLVNTLLKDASKDAERKMFGKEVRAGVPWIMAAGAVGVGGISGVGKAEEALGKQTLINGPLNTQGVMQSFGSVNESLTPLFTKGKKIDNFGADGNVPLALHKKRNSGVL